MAVPKLTIDATTDPSEDTVEGWCADRTAEINGRLNAAGIIVPAGISESDDWSTDWPEALPGAQRTLRSVTVAGVIAYVYERLNVSDESDEETESFSSRFYRRLEGIANNPRRILQRNRPGPRAGKRPRTAQRYVGAIW